MEPVEPDTAAPWLELQNTSGSEAAETACDGKLPASEFSGTEKHATKTADVVLSVGGALT